MTPRKTDVALISPFPPPFGGMSILADTIRRCLESRGITVLCINTNPLISLPGILKRTVGEKIVSSFLFYLSLRMVGRSEAIVIIASSGHSFFVKVLPALFFGKLCGKRVVLDFVGGEIERKVKRYPFMWRSLFALFDAIIVPTRRFQEILLKERIECLVVPHIVDISRFSPKTDKPDKPTFLALKNLSELSGVDTLIRAFAEVKRIRSDAVLYIVGDGPERKKLETLAATLDISDVHFIGNVKYGSIPDMFHKTTVFIHGAQYESFGIVLVEAFASGVPIVSSNVGGIPDIVTDGINGFLFPYGDFRLAAERMLTLLQDEYIYRTFQKNGLIEAKKYSCAIISPKLLQVLNIQKSRAGNGCP